MPWHLWGCMAIAFLIPFAKKFVPGFIGLLSIYVIVYAIRRKRTHFPTFNLPNILLLSIFILHVIGLLWSAHRNEGLSEIGIKLSYAIFPLIAWLMPPLGSKQSSVVMNWFLFGCVAFIPMAIGYGIYRSVVHHDWAWLTYQQLGIYLHPTYAATYMSFALLILWRNEMDGTRPLRKSSYAYVAGIVILIFISMLASKAGFIAALIVITMASYYTYQKRKTLRDALIHAFGAFLILGLSAWLAPGSITRVEAAVQDLEKQQTDVNAPQFVHVEAKSSTELRLVSWSASSKLLFEKPLGAGTGETQHAINARYVEAGEQYAADKNLNAHNQFLQAGAEHGWAGLLLLVSLMLVILVKAVRERNQLMLAFVLLCGMNFLFESFLEVQAGIVFFCFMIMVFTKQQIH